MIRAVIVEDEKMSRETLRRMLGKYCPDVEVVAEAETYRQGIAAIRAFRPDAVFLDIQMPDGSGFRVLEELKEIDFEVIFTTAFDQFAIKAIKYNALDYLLKPIIPEELAEAVKRLQQRKEAAIAGLRGSDKVTEGGGAFTRKIILSTSEMIHVIHVDEIIRCESDNYYTMFFFTDGRRLLVSKTLKENEEILSRYDFIRPHKSHLVNKKYIKSYLRHEGGAIIMIDGTKVPVSRRKRDDIMGMLRNL
jgi:two-component system LytT family response regulator